jgi:hypothetical protein
MRAPGKPAVSFFTRVDLETDARRRRLQERTGKTLPNLVAEALRLMELELQRKPKPAA